MTKWMRTFVITNLLLWGAVLGGMLQGAQGVELPASVGFCVAMIAVSVVERAARRRQGKPANASTVVIPSS